MRARRTLSSNVYEMQASSFSKTLRTMAICILATAIAGCGALSFEKERAAQSKILDSIGKTPLPKGFSIIPDIYSGLQITPNCQINLDCGDVGASVSASSKPLSAPKMCEEVANWAELSGVKTTSAVKASDYLITASATSPFYRESFLAVCEKFASSGDVVLLSGEREPVDGFHLEFTLSVGGLSRDTNGPDPIDPDGLVSWLARYSITQPAPE